MAPLRVASPCLRAGPLNLLRCPINRQQPCAAAQLQCPPRASPWPTRWSSCPGDVCLPHPGLPMLLAQNHPAPAGAPGKKPRELQRQSCSGVSTLAAEATLGQGIYIGLRGCPVWRSCSTLFPWAVLFPFQILDLAFAETLSVGSLDWLSCPAWTLQQLPVGPPPHYNTYQRPRHCLFHCLYLHSNPRATAGMGQGWLGYSRSPGPHRALKENQH